MHIPEADAYITVQKHSALNAARNQNTTDDYTFRTPSEHKFAWTQKAVMQDMDKSKALQNQIKAFFLFGYQLLPWYHPTALHKRDKGLLTNSCIAFLLFFPNAYERIFLYKINL